MGCKDTPSIRVSANPRGVQFLGSTETTLDVARLGKEPARLLASRCNLPVAPRFTPLGESGVCPDENKA